jgi:hypothetical protein
MRQIALAAMTALSFWGCGSSSNGPADPTEFSPRDAALPPDASATVPDAGAAVSDAATAPDASTGEVTLTINNFLAWCAVSVTQPAGAALADPAKSATNTLSEPAGTVVVLHAVAASAAFEWVPAGGTGGWSGSIDVGQDPTAHDVTVTLDSSKTVDVCCPFADGTGC